MTILTSSQKTHGTMERQMQDQLQKTQIIPIIQLLDQNCTLYHIDIMPG